MAGIYLHIPFCKQQCTYCDFHFSTTFAEYRTEMIDAIRKEITERVDYLEGRAIETIYFGGGTPSLLFASELSVLIDEVKSNYPISAHPEITLEANPDDITSENLKNWRQVGINRLSIGLQSFKAEDLKWMNRAHSTQEGLDCIELAKSEGFHNLTVDLMYGLPELSMEDWQRHIQTVISMDVPHISAYCLTIEEKTALHHMVKKGAINPASEDIQSDQFLLLLNMLEQNGYAQYEISNFSKPGAESRHNSNYWKGEWYLGVGPSAHSFNGVSRSWNIRNNRKYLIGIEANETVSETEILTVANQFNERILTGLRTTYGVNIQDLQKIGALPPHFVEQVSDFEQSGWLEVKGHTLFLTKEGRLRADHIASELFV
jgi:oxygen-independent coproporphyrinogen-3 oxidase